MGEPSVDPYNAVIQTPKCNVKIAPPTQKELDLFDYNHNKEIDNNYEKECLIRHRNIEQEEKFAKEEFDDNHNGVIDDGFEKKKYRNHKIGTIVHFFSKTNSQDFNSVENIERKIANELSTSDKLPKVYTNEELIDDLYSDIKYNNCKTYINILCN